MTDLGDTLYVAAHWCPGCAPDRDPVREILEVRYCETHRPEAEGSDDARVAGTAYLSGSAEAGGDDGNRAWYAFLHRGARRAAAIALLLLAGCAAAPPRYVCLGALTSDGVPVLPCAPIATKAISE